MTNAHEGRAKGGRFFYFGTVVLVAVVTLVLLMLLDQAAQRKNEVREPVVRLADVTEETTDPALWARDFPRQYDAYLRTVDEARTRHGGSEAFQKLDADPLWRELYAGYPFGIDYREERGHAYMLQDQRETERVTRVEQPGACLHCHASVIPAYRRVGREAGAPGDGKEALASSVAQTQLRTGFEAVCAMPYREATKLVEHPVSCIDCHDPATMGLRVTRPAFLEGIAALARSDDPIRHVGSIARWRRSARAEAYDPNRLATRQELRTLVCAQCHVEYYLREAGQLVVYPWSYGLQADAVERYYDDLNHSDWPHLRTRAPLLKAQHPEFELWSQGIHARSGVACADCHMPTLREGGEDVTSHHVRSPLLDVHRSCQTCHDHAEDELVARAEAIQGRTQELMLRAERATVALVEALEAALGANVGAEAVERAQRLHRKAQWRLDFVASENSMGFHAPQEAARLLGEAIDYARQGAVVLLEARVAGDDD